MRANLKVFYSIIITLLFFLPATLMAEKASYEVFKAYQTYSRNWMNMNAPAIATENFHANTYINNDPIKSFNTAMIEQEYSNNFSILKENDYWYSEEILSFCKQSESVYQIFNHYDRYKKDGTLLQGQLATTYIMEKRDDAWKFVYMSSIDGVWLNTGCDQYRNYEFLKKDKQFREATAARWKGDFIKLDDGYTFYEQANANADQHIVFVHGFSVPSYIWEPTYQEAIKRGYGVIRYDTFGRGFSDNPNVEYSTELYVNQLKNLLDSLAIEKVNLIGLSDGGRTVAMMAARYPERINELIFIAPSGFHEDTEFQTKDVAQIEIENFITNAYPKIGNGQLSDFYEPEKFTTWETRYNGLLKYQGFARALLSTRKNYPKMTTIHEKIHTNKISTSFIWGTHDKVLPLNEVKTKLAELLPRATLFEFTKSGHLAHMEEEKRFNRILFEEILK